MCNIVTFRVPISQLHHLALQLITYPPHLRSTAFRTKLVKLIYQNDVFIYIVLSLVPLRPELFPYFYLDHKSKLDIFFES